MKNKSLLFIIGLIVIVGLIIWFATGTDQQVADESLDAGEDTTTAIQEDLDGINIDDIEAEFDDIDAELETL